MSQSFTRRQYNFFLVYPKKSWVAFGLIRNFDFCHIFSKPLFSLQNQYFTVLVQFKHFFDFLFFHLIFSESANCLSQAAEGRAGESNPISPRQGGCSRLLPGSRGGAPDTHEHHHWSIHSEAYCEIIVILPNLFGYPLLVSIS